VFAGSSDQLNKGSILVKCCGPQLDQVGLHFFMNEYSGSLRTLLVIISRKNLVMRVEIGLFFCLKSTFRYHNYIWSIFCFTYEL
jgi:hypothetical protein